MAYIHMSILPVGTQIRVSTTTDCAAHLKKDGVLIRQEIEDCDNGEKTYGIRYEDGTECFLFADEDYVVVLINEC